MFPRRLMRTAAVLRRASKDGGVLAAIRSELAHELSSSPPSPPPSFTFSSEDAPGFATVSDEPQAQDLLLRRRTDSEEVLVSALLAPLQFHDHEPLPRTALMKVLVTKPGKTPVLHFDCRTSCLREYSGIADYAIHDFRYHASAASDGEEKYVGPLFRNQLCMAFSVKDRDEGNLAASGADDGEEKASPCFRAALQEYLVARGVTSNLATSILRHLLQKERAQYVNWLKMLEERFSKDV